MKKLIPFLLVFLCFACGENSVPEQGLTESILQVDTVNAVDSIGILMGDSCYVLGAVADFTTLPEGRPAILDRVKGTVSVFDSTGTFQFSFGGFGEGPGEFQYPFFMTRLNSGIFVVAEMMGNITAMDSNGEFLDKWKIEGMGGLPLDCIPFDDSTFVCYYFGMKMEDAGFSVNYSLKRYHALTGEVLTSYMDWTGEPNPATDFTPAYLVAAGDGNGKLFVSRVENPIWLIEVFGENPEPVDSIVAFPERERIALQDTSMIPGVMAVRYAFSDGESEMQQASVNMPETHPLISGLGVDSEGSIWCRRGGLPGNVWDVVSPEGEHLREVLVQLPDSTFFIEVDVNPRGILAFDMFTEDYHKIYIMEQ